MEVQKPAKELEVYIPKTVTLLKNNRSVIVIEVLLFIIFCCYNIAHVAEQLSWILEAEN